MKTINDKTKRLHNDRVDFSKISGNFEVPNLVGIQIDSFEWFKNEGIAEVFNEIFPVESYSKDIEIGFEGFRFDTPKYTYLEC